MASLSERYSKSVRKQLRELAGTTYERELGEHLAELEKSFRTWRAGEIYASELTERVHEFHQGASRDLFSLYQSFKADQIVARGLCLGLLSDSDVPESVREALSDEIRRFGNLKDVVD